MLLAVTVRDDLRSNLKPGAYHDHSKPAAAPGPGPCYMGPGAGYMEMLTNNVPSPSRFDITDSPIQDHESLRITASGLGRQRV